jgi:uncharacterized protein (TIGR02996 family)
MRLEEAFLADVIEHPDDDVPRLVFADWLDDQGEAERAELIRVQVELARLPADDPRRTALQWREADLLGRNLQRWMAPVADCSVSSPDFRRGFIEAVDCHAAALLDSGGRLFARAPIRELTLYASSAYLSTLARREWLARLVTLRLIGEGTQPAQDVFSLHSFAELVCASPHLRHLRVLDLSGCALGASRIVVLALSRSLPALAELGLAGNELDDEAARALAGSPQRHGLEVLDLGNNVITNRGATLLASSPHLGRLRWLRLDGNPIGDAGILALLGSAALPRLTHLGCDQARLSAGVREHVRQRFGAAARHRVQGG